MGQTLDPLDTRLLALLQEQVPLTERPWRELADKLAISEAEVLVRVTALRASTPEKRGVIRQISAIFDSKSLGYQSTLVAAKIPSEQLEHAVAVINAHPGVSHNYLRNHDFNLWYTLAVPPDSALGLERTLDILHRNSHALATRPLPTLRLFKIGVRLDLTGEGDTPAAPAYTQSDRDRSGGGETQELDKRIIRILQQDLPATARPFDLWAQEADLAPGKLIEQAEALRARGVMRRFSAVLRHREVGFSANAMGIWVVPESRVESFGQTAATFQSVSHCYLRPTYSDWPYNLFTMVHAKTPADCEAVLRQIAAATNTAEYSALYSSREFKKVRVRYFTPEVGEWEKGEGG